jgi:hypothetical protein
LFQRTIATCRMEIISWPTSWNRLGVSLWPRTLYYRTRRNRVVEKQSTDPLIKFDQRSSLRVPHLDGPRAMDGASLGGSDSQRGGNPSSRGRGRGRRRGGGPSKVGPPAFRNKTKKFSDAVGGAFASSPGTPHDDSIDESEQAMEDNAVAEAARLSRFASQTLPNNRYLEVPLAFRRHSHPQFFILPSVPSPHFVMPAQAIARSRTSKRSRSRQCSR